MAIGSNIKALRTKKGLTQKDLADELHVSFQAVSRWENDETEPSIDSLTDLTRVLDCTLDELFGHETEPVPVPEPTVVEKVVYEEYKPILCLCERCNNPIYEKGEIHRVSVKEKDDENPRSIVLCTSCDKKHKEEEKRKAEEEHQKVLDRLKKHRVHSFIWPSILAAIFLTISILFYANDHSYLGTFFMVMFPMSFTFLACLILDNNIIMELWGDVATFGAVRMPGIIFTFDLDGLAFLIAVKILFAVIAFLIGLGFIILATLLGFFCSIFCYPLAISRNMRNIDYIA